MKWVHAHCPSCYYRFYLPLWMALLPIRCMHRKAGAQHDSWEQVLLAVDDAE